MSELPFRVGARYPPRDNDTPDGPAIEELRRQWGTGTPIWTIAIGDPCEDKDLHQP